MSESFINKNDNYLTASPIDMLVEITNRCNHSCLFCAHHKMEQKQGEIDSSLLRRILCEAYEMGLRRVGLYTTGEMFMCKNLEAHIRNAKEIGYEYIYSDTNGALASEENLIKIISAGLDSIKFSINAGKKETYALIHGHDDFNKVIENLKICHKLKFKMNPKLKILVSFVVTRQTEEEVELLSDMVTPYVDAFMPYPVQAFFQQYDYDLSHFKTEMYSDIEQGITIPCSMVMNRIHVTYDGFLSACCVDFNHDLLLADLKKSSLSEAWTSENAIEFRRKHFLRKVEDTMCYGCSMGKFVPYSPLKIFPRTNKEDA